MVIMVRRQNRMYEQSKRDGGKRGYSGKKHRSDKTVARPVQGRVAIQFNVLSEPTWHLNAP